MTGTVHTTEMGTVLISVTKLKLRLTSVVTFNPSLYIFNEDVFLDLRSSHMKLMFNVFNSSHLNVEFCNAEIHLV